MRFRVDNLVAGYGRIEVVHGVSLEVPEGDRVGLFGPNGHGKTTLLRAISGLIDRRAGGFASATWTSQAPRPRAWSRKASSTCRRAAPCSPA